jgi:hypothetical protein
MPCRRESAPNRERRYEVAIIIAAAATRIERLKHLRRTDPTSDAATEFTKWEFEATLLMKRKYLRKGEV